MLVPKVLFWRSLSPSHRTTVEYCRRRTDSSNFESLPPGSTTENNSLPWTDRSNFDSVPPGSKAELQRTISYHGRTVVISTAIQKRSHEVCIPRKTGEEMAKNHRPNQTLTMYNPYQFPHITTPFSPFPTHFAKCHQTETVH